MSRWLMFALATAVPMTVASGASAAEGLKIVVILDNSGSMQGRMPGGGSRIAAAKQALLTVLEQTPSDAEVGVLLLNPNRGQPWLIPLGPLDEQSTRQAVNGIRANGPTPLGSAMKLAADELLKAREESRYGTYKLLVVSDGEATDGDLVERYLPQVQARGLLVDVIGVAMGRQHSLATRANTYRSADDQQSLQQAISAVVLGESGADSGDAGQSDFELLEPLPAEVAAASLTALTTAPKGPLGAGDSGDANWGQALPGGPAPGAPAPRVALPQGAPAPPQDQEEGGSIMRYVLFFVVAFFLIRMMSSVGKSH